MKQFFSLENKHILVTGASSGIGRATAIRLSEAGASISIVGRNEGRLRETFEALNGNEHSLFIQDLTDFEQNSFWISEAIEKRGPLHGLVHSAGMQLTLPLRNMNAEKYHDIFSINVIAGLELIKLLAKKGNYSAEGASVVFMSSVMAHLSKKALTAYSASKGAINSAVRALTAELKNKQIRVNSVSPGYINTELLNDTSLDFLDQNMGSVSDVSSSVHFLMSDESRWIMGSDIIVDGGYSVIGN